MPDVFVQCDGIEKLVGSFTGEANGVGATPAEAIDDATQEAIRDIQEQLPTVRCACDPDATPVLTWELTERAAPPAYIIQMADPPLRFGARRVLTYKIGATCRPRPAAPPPTVQTSSSTYKKVSMTGGRIGFALVPGSALATVPLPPYLGGGELALSRVTGHALVEPGEVAGARQTFRLVQLELDAAPLCLTDGRTSGAIRVRLAPDAVSHGWLDLDTRQVYVEAHEWITSELLGEAAPIRVHSRQVGFYDEESGEARLVGRAVDSFPPAPPAPQSAG